MVEVVVPTPQPLAMAGMDANLTDSSGRIDSFARGKFVCSFPFLSWLPVRFFVSNSFLGFQFVPWTDMFDQAAVDEEASSPSRNGEELAAAAGQLEPPPPPSDQPVEAAEAPQPLPNDELEASGDAPGSSQPPAPWSEAENNERMFTDEEFLAYQSNLGGGLPGSVLLLDVRGFLDFGVLRIWFLGSCRRHEGPGRGCDRLVAVGEGTCKPWR
jgi:hypothetical protein